ncbi:hypothetical protein TorRG33x02_043290 [Trema orientale]|uniref:Uncharacterized protein n=1 Tax=Trema orientale TaxID=63057 RepID=A0A2P5FQ28_TREOI|nr:hypothetical protein TorRG33x02_043290 [Trema orientale]
MGTKTNKLAIDLGCLGYAICEQGSRRNLRPNMKMQQLKAIKHIHLLKLPHHAENLRRGEPKLPLFAGSRPEMARVLGPELGADANHRTNRELPAQFNHQIELVLLFQNNNRVQSELPRNQSERNVLEIFEAIADQEGIRVTFTQTAHSQEKLRLRPGFQPKPERGSELHNVLHNKPVLVTFHRINTLVMGLIVLRLDRQFEGRLERLEPVLEHIGEANNERKLQTQPANRFRIRNLLNNLQQINLLVGQSGRAVRANSDVAGGVDGEVRGTPPINFVQSSRQGRRPMGRTLYRRGGGSSGSGGGGCRRRNAGKCDQRGKRAIPGESVAGRSCSSGVNATRQGRHL